MPYRIEKKSHKNERDIQLRLASNKSEVSEEKKKQKQINNETFI